MRLVFSTEAWDDYQHWVATDKKVLKRTNLLIKDAMRDPFEGIGHPEPLRHVLAGAWSRRITQEHRMVYGIEDGDLVVYQCRYHYER